MYSYQKFHSVSKIKAVLTMDAWYMDQTPGYFNRVFETVW